MEQTLSITYDRKTLGADSFWAYMIQEEETIQADAVTAAQAAEIIDSLYEVKACGTEEEQESASTGGDSNVPDFETWDEYNARMTGAFAPVYNPCENVYTDNSYRATLRVYLSDITKPYKLNLSNADVVQTATITNEVTKTYPINSDRLTVDIPIQGNLSANYPIQDSNSKTILFTEHIIGAVDVKYTTKYYEVLINVNAIDEERSDCLCLLFYQETVNEVSISPPDIDEEGIDTLQCHPAQDAESGQEPYGPIEHEEGECYVRYSHRTRCRCTPYKLIGSYDEIRVVPCSTPFSSANPQGAYELHRTINLEGYITCPDSEDWEGGTEEYYIEQCCVPPPPHIGLPNCKERKAVDYGGQSIVKGYDYYSRNALHNQVINLVPVSPKDGICGEITYIQDVASENCCDDEFITPLDYDEENSVEILGDYSSGIVFFSGGSPESVEKGYHVSVRGSGFFIDFERTHTDAIIYGHSFIVYTEDACGSCTVTITDGCSETFGEITATDGQWVTIASGQEVIDMYKPIEADEKIGSMMYAYLSTTLRLKQTNGYTSGTRGGTSYIWHEDPICIVCAGYSIDWIENASDWNASGCIYDNNMYVPVEGHTLCWENWFGFCHVSTADGAQNPYYPGNYKHSWGERAKAYGTVYLQEWQC